MGQLEPRALPKPVGFFDLNDDHPSTFMDDDVEAVSSDEHFPLGLR